MRLEDWRTFWAFAQSGGIGKFYQAFCISIIQNMDKTCQSHLIEPMPKRSANLSTAFSRKFLLVFLLLIPHSQCNLGPGSFDNDSSNSDLSFLFPSFPIRAPSPVGRTNVCANSGRFLGAYCLGDFNCNGGKPGSRQVCIRGHCCSKTRTSKTSVNRRTAEDRGCPAGTFNVGLSCRRNRDCAQKAINSLADQSPPPFPLLECARQSGRCCTSSRYRKPLAPGQLCLNGGTANGKGSCVSHSDCRDAHRRFGLCVDSQCCTPKPKKPATDDFDDDGTLADGEDGISDLEDGLDFDDEAQNGDWPEEGNQEDLYNEFEDDDVLLKAGDSLRDGRRVCRRFGLAYRQVRRCTPGRSASCGNAQRFRCLSGHCCLRGPAGANNNRNNAAADDDEYADDEYGQTAVGWNGGRAGGRVPAGAQGFCVSAGRFRRFLGQMCRRAAVDCPRALDARRRRIPIRCVRGACCAAMRRLGGQANGGAMDTGDQQGQLIPGRPAGSAAFCFDGTLSRRQCHSKLDCPVPSRQSCVNNLCCAPTTDQERYACGGLASTGQCTASAVALSSSAGCRDRLHCVSPGACCECRHGRPQTGVSDCRGGRGTLCKSGFACDQSSGFCCPRCADQRMPFGSCYLGKCGPGFVCRPGNICCSLAADDDDAILDEEYLDGVEEDFDNNLLPGRLTSGGGRLGMNDYNIY